MILLALFPGCAEAHPLDEVVHGAYLTLAPGEVRLELALTPGPKVAGALLKSLDPNADQHITEAEARLFALRVLDQSTLMLDGAAASWTLNHVTVPPYPNLELGSDTIKIHAVAKRIDSAGTHTLSYQNKYQPAASRLMTNIFLQAGKGWQYRITKQRRSDDGGRLTVNYTVARP